jgi:hypothetical protein
VFEHHLLSVSRDTNSVQAIFTPILSAYVTMEYKQTQIIRAEILSRVLLTEDLAVLEDTTTFVLSMSPSGAFVLTQANAAK